MTHSTALLQIMTHVLTKDPTLTARAIQVFLLVARKQGRDGVVISDLVNATGLNQSTVSRIVGQLSDQPQRGQRQPMRWLETFSDPNEHRRLRIRVAPAGVKMLEELGNFNTQS